MIANVTFFSLYLWSELLIFWKRNEKNTKNNCIIYADFTTTAALAYLLKKAASVDQALELLKNIDMHSDIGTAHHYAIADASGKKCCR
ncbi:MAG: hypothetical protein II956_07900 [Bacteroidales bacterium]|nr:hypothetical protein [Bacteroidales bacterium]